ncbi:MAG TPA: hypothetical protein PKO05_05280 [Thermoanaerobaculia bacterium]|jgi:hypothetical protein|nr:hypothetical protein [Thermoanaerobaculia bacterium]MDI9631331.1 hypothetical protein [Acidobacteriota bacterium]MBP7813995.1 hypothetical protein [Thermoanaerobaculia bacterium]MBP8845293.1 hypothetical protein [Thermoanaerobaculia bacterium]HNU82823.1 hypothetical protein [Thermoanaerobaculia bacterium]
MTIRKPLALVIGGLTLLPAVLLAIAFALFLLLVVAGEGHHRGPGYGLLATMIGLFVVTILLIIGLLVFYIAHLFKNPRLQQETRILWVLVLFLSNQAGLGFVACIIYWWLHIWSVARAETNTDLAAT